MISIIAAIGKNKELGKDNKLLWHIKADMERFRRLTINQVVIMGRKTFFSLPKKFQPLPKRINIVISKKVHQPIKQSSADNQTKLIFTDSVEKALNIAKKFNREIFIAGGASIYNQTLSLADKLYLTIVEKSYPEADVFFPAYNHLFSKIIFQSEGEENGLRFRFLELIK